ncbi:MAG: adenylyltransferase/cytidyltransferase family protein [Candidatus Buchananbacteria bacterium]|nr:adenylyltransferase/cytidyltransferase family protein [Candidatus Buchananbacteria bacterium]
MKRVMVFGTFDILHDGHLDFFRQARAYGDYLIVVVARDRNVETIKGKKPDFSEDERLVAVQEAGVADEVILGGEGDPHEIIRTKRPQVICLGYDQEVFTGNLAAKFPEINIVRLEAYQPEIYKSSKLKAKK